MIATCTHSARVPACPAVTAIFRPRSALPARLLRRAVACAGALASALRGAAAGRRRRCACPRWATERGEDFSVGTERTLGDQIMREIRRDPDYLDDPVLLDYVQASGSRCSRRRARAARSRPTPTQRFAWEVVPGARPQRQRLRAARRLCRRAPGPDRRSPARATNWPPCWRTSCRTSRSATSRAASSTAAHHAAQPGGHDPRRAGRQPRSSSPTARRPRWSRRAGGHDPGPAELLARHGARGRPRRLRRARPMPAIAPAAWPACSRSSKTPPPQRQRLLPLPAQPPADRRAHRRGARARQQRASPALGSAFSSTPCRRARAC